MEIATKLNSVHSKLIQSHIQGPVNHLQGRFMRKQLTAKSC